MADKQNKSLEDILHSQTARQELKENYDLLKRRVDNIEEIAQNNSPLCEASRCILIYKAFVLILFIP